MKMFLKPKHVCIWFIPILILWISDLNAQNLAVLLEENLNQPDKQQSCFTIRLENRSEVSVKLAGQNYRLYYNSDAGLLKESSVVSKLSTAYTPLKLVEHRFDIDASGFGVLPYDAHLGFINLATDLNLNAGNPLTLSSGQQLVVAELCFNVSEDEVPQITWAQDNLTHTYATAFVELALMDANGQTHQGNISVYKVTSKGNTNIQEATVFSTKYYPNPFSDRLNLSFNQALDDNSELKVYDVFGKLVLTRNLKKGITSFELKGNDVPNGALLINITNAQGEKTTLKAIKIN